MRKSRADIVKHFPMVLSQPPIISSPRDFLTMGWFPCSANPIPARVQSTLSPRGKAEEEDEDSLSQFILSVSFCHWPKGFGEGVRSSPLFGILGDPGSLTPAIWLPGIMDDPCTRCPERGGMADCKESLRSSVLIWKKTKKQRNCGMREQGWAVGSRGWKRLLSGNFQPFPWLEIMVIPALHSIPWTIFLLCQAQSPPLIYSIKTANNQFQLFKNQKFKNQKQLFKV